MGGHHETLHQTRAGDSAFCDARHARHGRRLPGKGVSVSPIKGSPANAWFQHMVVQLGLEALGYEMEETLEADFPAVHLAVASGDADYTFNHWKHEVIAAH